MRMLVKLARGLALVTVLCGAVATAAMGEGDGPPTL